jgi:hypothetical protein
MSAPRPLSGPVLAEGNPPAGDLPGRGRGSARRIRPNLEELKRRIGGTAARMERPILQVGAFLESIQDLELAKPSSTGGSRLVVALQSYDMFHQEIQLVENLIELLTMGLGEFPEQAPIMPADSLMANFESLCFHMDSARALIENSASEIPHAIAHVLRGAGAASENFQNWGFAKPLGEIVVLTSQLGATGNEIEGLRLALAFGLGVDSGSRHTISGACEEAGLDDGSVLLF